VPSTDVRRFVALAAQLVLKVEEQIAEHVVDIAPDEFVDLLRRDAMKLGVFVEHEPDLMLRIELLTLNPFCSAIGSRRLMLRGQTPGNGS
jgi:hypothetical protein